ncbi:hypothetical protein [Arthrobacter gengyunqii]|uniref:Uncharacterized protein n=1 Tax=Arthrobacter gengyunqii TaxID=2886940 RepID=A0ABS8GMW5_9MICC|nr:hypothetical protein [Arthrobacter gengyunqii]MCC3267688.1 hypothetical protein [Arthrobacter gengyunqii]
MSTFIDLSGTAGLPIPSELEESAAAILHRGSNVNDALQRVHAKWSLLTGAYSAPEQARVQGAMDRPRDAGEAVLQAASHAATALRIFAAAVEGIRRKRLELQAQAVLLLEKENNDLAPAAALPAGNLPLSLPAFLLQSNADQLALELSAAEDECMRSLARLQRSADAPEQRGL